MAIENLKKHLIIAPLIANIAFWLYIANPPPPAAPEKNKASPKYSKNRS
jgi:hypothetical protein